MNDFIITAFENALYIEDAKGKKINFENRRCASFIVTVKGKICFSYGGGYVISDAKHAVFLPKGLSYTNRCIESAESYVFNFHTQNQYEKPMQLGLLYSKTAEEIYEKINVCTQKIQPQVICSY
ncbi:MAG: hypothetical protein J6A69_10015 [Clostridia bacterium]|nr:hypothetical protein [Clostridia bacterium]